MDKNRYAKVRELFFAAQELPASKRSSYLSESCGEDESLQLEVESLLGHSSEEELIQERVRQPAKASRPAVAGTKHSNVVTQPHGGDARDPLGLVGTVIDGRYRVERFVDEGGFGVVYRATHEFWHKPVAIKFFKADFESGQQSEKLRQAFLKEGAVLNDLSRQTTSIVQSHDVGLWTNPRGGSHLFTVLEWLDGQTLDAFVESEQIVGGAWGWALGRAVATLGPIAEALSVAHENGIAHRDIKPANIFLVRGTDTASYTPKLLDFGIAKVTSVERRFETTGKSLAACSVAYAAPEQLNRAFGATGPWTDVYSLALVCTELLCGKHPVGTTELGALVAAASDPTKRPTPGSFGVEIPPEAEKVFEKALQLKPGDRYQNAGEFWAAMESCTEGLPGNTRSRFGHLAQGGTPAHTTAPPVSGSEPASRAPATRFVVPLAVVAGALGLWGIQTLAADGDEGGRSGAPKLGSRSIERQRLASFAPLTATTPSRENTVASAQTQLGRSLFWDPRLSRDEDISCATCHELANYGVDGLPVSVGHGRQHGARNAPSVFNRGNSFALMWDGSSPTLEHQASRPILNPKEMAMTEEAVLERLDGIPEYEQAFQDAFPNAEEPISMDHVSEALAAFQRRLTTEGSRWDQFLNGDEEALNAEERAGFNAFVEVGCVTCHFGPLVGDTMFQKLGLVRAWPYTRDRGRFEVTKRNADWMVFRVPSLRNVTKTAPYFHDGSVSSLPEAVRLMGRHQLGEELDHETVEQIVAWLGTLTGDLPKDLVEKPTLPGEG